MRTVGKDVFWFHLGVRAASIKWAVAAYQGALLRALCVISVAGSLRGRGRRFHEAFRLNPGRGQPALEHRGRACVLVSLRAQAAVLSLTSK